MDQFVRYIQGKVYSYRVFIRTICPKSIVYPTSHHVTTLTHFFSDILCDYIKHLIPAKPPVNVTNKLIYK